MTMKKIKLNLKITQILLLGGLLALAIAIFIDCQIVFNDSVLAPTAGSKTSLKLNDNILKKISDNQKNDTTLSQSGNIGKSDPFSALQ